MAQGLSGVNLGRYRVLELVGQGGMASVYRAEDPRLFRQVAIKVPHAHLAADPDFSARFLREAQAVAALRHPNIVQVFDFGEEGATAFMVMELIEGPTLAAMLAELTGRAAFMSPTDVVALGSAIGSAIDYAAARGMIHRDIKPSNIIMDGGRRPVLTDYGIARVLGATSHTVPGIVVGSAHYMSPEQAQGLPLDARSDLYSLAVVLFEALTGRVPFGGETTMTVLMQHMTTPPPPVRSYNRLLPAGFDPTLARALAKDPAHRYQNGAELGGALHAALAEVAQAPTRVVERASIPDAASGRTRIDLPAATGGQLAATPPAQDSLDVTQVALPGVGTIPGQHVPVRRRPPVWAMIGAVLAVIGVLTTVVVLATRNGGTSTEASSTKGPVTTRSSQTEVNEAGSPEEQAQLAEADVLLWNGQIIGASERYLAILRSNRSFALAHRQLGIAYYMMTDSNYQAETQLRLAAEAIPDDATTAAFLGKSIYRQQRRQRTTDFAEAEEWLRKAAQLDQTSALPHAFLAELLAASGRRDEARQEAEKALALDPGSSWAQFASGITFGFADEWDRAVDPYTKAVALNPSWPNLYPALIEALRLTGRYHEALEYCVTLQKLGQGYEAEALGDKGFTLKDAGDKQGAIEAFNASLALDDTDNYVHWGLASLLYDEARYEEALPHFQRAVALAPAEPAYHSWLALCLLEMERHDEARTEAKKALELDPANEDAQWVLDQLTAQGRVIGDVAQSRGRKGSSVCSCGYKAQLAEGRVNERQI